MHVDVSKSSLLPKPNMKDVNETDTNEEIIASPVCNKRQIETTMN